MQNLNDLLKKQLMPKRTNGISVTKLKNKKASCPSCTQKFIVNDKVPK